MGKTFLNKFFLFTAAAIVLMLIIWPAFADTTCTTNWYCDDWGNCSAVTDCYDY